MSSTKYSVFSSNKPCSNASPIENIFNDDPGSYCALVLIKSIFIDSLSPLCSAEINTSPVLAFAKTTEQLKALVSVSYTHLTLPTNDLV